VTANGMTVSPDMRRRSLFAELHQEVELPEDKNYKRDLELPQILALRPITLAALWALVRHWDAQGRPKPSRSHSAFPLWANIVGGIVEAAGYTCPLATANVAATADPDGQDMRLLVNAMALKPKPLAFAELVKLSQDEGLFEGIVGTSPEIDRSAKAAFGCLLGRYDRRVVSNWRFLSDGKGHQRRYRVEPQHGDMVPHGVSDR
jgi:hypothetical protein